MEKNKGIKILDLFCGCGGLSFGFSKEDFDVVLGIDNWPVSLETYAKNHPGAKTGAEDLSKVSPAEIAAKFGLGKIDLIIGGPPCQGFSISGKRIIDDPRNKLYKSFVRFVEYYGPKAFLMENVPNLLSLGGGRIKDEIIEDFSRLGYTVSYKVLLASDYGVPQNRKRVVFVGLKNGVVFEFPKPSYGVGQKIKITVKEAIGDLPENDVPDGARYPVKPFSEYQKTMRSGSIGIFNHETIKHSEKTKFIINMVPDGGNYKNLPEEYRHTRKVNIAWTRFASSKPSTTIDTGHNHHFHYAYNRVPTARESARLQSFDDNFIFCGKKNEQIKQIGNAVPPLLARQIARQLKAYMLS